MAITKSSSCVLTATEYFSDETTPIVPDTFEDISLMYYSVTQYCNNDVTAYYNLYQAELNTPLFGFSQTSGSFPGNAVGTIVMALDRPLTFVSGTRSDGTTTIGLTSSNWHLLSINTASATTTYTWNLQFKDAVNNQYSFVTSTTVYTGTYSDYATFVDGLNSASTFTDNTTYITTPDYCTIEADGTIVFNSYAFDTTTETVIGNGVYSVSIYQKGFSNVPSTEVGQYTAISITTSQCVLSYCNLQCDAVQASTLESVSKAELWALIEALKQADICETCNADLCNILDYVQDIIDETNCKC